MWFLWLSNLILAPHGEVITTPNLQLWKWAQRAKLVHSKLSNKIKLGCNSRSPDESQWAFPLHHAATLPVPAYLSFPPQPRHPTPPTAQHTWFVNYWAVSFAWRITPTSFAQQKPILAPKTQLRNHLLEELSRAFPITTLTPTRVQAERKLFLISLHTFHAALITLFGWHDFQKIKNVAL